MSLTVAHIEEEDEHRWAVVHGECDLDDTGDPLVCSTVETLRAAYGEEDVLAKIPAPDSDLGSSFDAQKIIATFRRGLPDPTKEEKKKPYLANFRSETAELVAKQALTAAHGIEFPTDPQRGKTNANQPILGFDHWGFLWEGDVVSFALVQTKGTEDPESPPAETKKLVVECSRVPTEPDKLARALSILAVHLPANSDACNAVLAMLERMDGNSLPELVVAPSVILGERHACLDDHGHLREAAKAAKFSPARARGVTVSVGASLTEFGRIVTTRAREAA